MSFIHSFINGLWEVDSHDVYVSDDEWYLKRKLLHLLGSRQGIDSMKPSIRIAVSLRTCDEVNEMHVGSF
jgi:hypothetical protein